jgi:hypothetical protein
MSHTFARSSEADVPSHALALTISNLTLCCILFRESNQYFRITIDPLVELVIGLRSFVDVDVMADNTARLCTSADNQVTKILVVFLDRRLPAAHGDPLVEELSDRKRKDALLCVTLGAGIRSDVHADDSDAARGIYNLQALGQR